MTEAERRLLLYVARALAGLLIWKNVDGRNDGLALIAAANEVESTAGVRVDAPRRCDCAAHSAADCVCGAWEKPALGVDVPGEEKS